MHPTGLDHGVSPDVQGADVAPGRVTSTRGAAALAAKESLSPTEQRIRELNRPDSPLWKTGTPEGDKARDELRRLLAQAARPEEQQEVADRSIHLLREQYRVDHNKVLKPLQETWDEHQEGTILATFAQNGVAPAAVTEVVEYYVSRFNSALGQIGNVDVAEMEAGARAIFKKHGVAAEVVDAVIEHEKQRLGLS